MFTHMYHQHTSTASQHTVSEGLILEEYAVIYPALMRNPAYREIEFK